MHAALEFLCYGRQHDCCGLMAMGGAVPGASPGPGGLPAKSRHTRLAKPSPRANEVGITSQEAVEFAISYAKQQRQIQEAQQGNQQHQPGREHQLSGPEGDKHYHTFTKSQSGQLTAGTRRRKRKARFHDSLSDWLYHCRQSICGCRGCGRQLDQAQLFRYKSLARNSGARLPTAGPL